MQVLPALVILSPWLVANAATPRKWWAQIINTPIHLTCEVLYVQAGRRRRVGGGVSGNRSCHALQVPQCDLHLYQSLPAGRHVVGLWGGHLRPAQPPIWFGQSQRDCVRACLCVGLTHTCRPPCRAAKVLFCCYVCQVPAQQSYLRSSFPCCMPL